jgi:hypothetical protein
LLLRPNGSPTKKLDSGAVDAGLTALSSGAFRLAIIVLSILVNGQSSASYLIVDTAAE